MRRVRRISLAFAVVLAGCFDGGVADGGDTDFMDDQPPSGCDTDACATSTTSGTSGTGGSTGAGSLDQCQSSADCGADQACVAEFTGTGRGVFQCVDVCLANMNEDMWCADAGACCDPGAVCTDRGYCVSDAGGGDTGTSG